MDDRNKLSEREKELNCIYRIDKLIEEKLDIHSFLIATCEIISDAFQYPQLTSVSIEYGDIVVKSAYFCEGKNSLVANITDSGKILGKIIVFITDNKIKNLFLKEEQILIDSVSKRISNFLILCFEEYKNLNQDKPQNIYIDIRYKILEDAVNSASFEDLGIFSIYLIGSVKNYDCGISSDIDLIIYYDGESVSMEKTKIWFQAWSESVLKSGIYKSEIDNVENIFDLHFIIKTDIEQGSSYAVMIKSLSNSARLIKTIL